MTTTTPQLIKDEIVAILKASQDLNDFGIMAYYEGFRKVVADTSYPFLVVDIGENDETPNDVIANVKSKITFYITGVIYVRDPDLQNNALLSIEHGIKKCLSNNVQLNGKAYNLTFGKTNPDKYEHWPVRAIVVPVEVDYRQNFLTRT